MLLTFLTSNLPLVAARFLRWCKVKLAKWTRVKECRSAITKSCHDSKWTQRSFKKFSLDKKNLDLAQLFKEGHVSASNTVTCPTIIYRLKHTAVNLLF